jgi:hypothetical protein
MYVPGRALHKRQLAIRCSIRLSLFLVARLSLLVFWCSLPRRLALFHLRLLSGMLLLELLRLLSMPLFHLLLLRVVVVLLGSLLVLSFLLLEFLVLLILLRSQLVLLLLILPVGCSVTGVWRSIFVRLQFAGVIAVGGRLGAICRTIYRFGPGFVSARHFTPRTHFVAA